MKGRVMALEAWKDPDAAIPEAVRLFNGGQFFEAHEVLEEAWRATSGPMKQFLKGLIHATVAFYQYERRNAHGACSKYYSTHYYLSPFMPEFAGIEVEGLLTGMDEFFYPLPEGPEGPWRGADWPYPLIRLYDPSQMGGLPQ